jgi:hypothetical protein
MLLYYDSAGIRADTRGALKTPVFDAGKVSKSND